jgi:hypothetical protein
LIASRFLQRLKSTFAKTVSKKRVSLRSPLGAKSLVGIAMPIGWHAGALTYQVAIDDNTWLNLQNGTTEVSIAAAAGQFIAIADDLWRGITELKLRSGTASAPVNQTADRVLTLVVRQNLA